MTERQPVCAITRGARQRISIAAQDLVRWSTLLPNSELPAVCQPAVTGIDLPQWAQAHRDDILRRLVHHGAIVFRGFSIADLNTFSTCIAAISGTPLEYRFRASPRTQFDPKLNIYSSTDYPAEERIFPHNEHSYSPVFPLHLYFYCEIPAVSGGETPLGDVRRLSRLIPAQLQEQFLRRQIMYVRNYGDGFGLPWRTVFQTDDRRVVETYCASVGIEVEWKTGERLRTRQVSPAVLRHPRTGDDIWFNHATFFNELLLPEVVRDSLRATFAADDLPQNTFYGDGSPIEPHSIQVLRQAYEACLVQFPWQQSDIVLLDNMLTMHGRNPYSGARRILTGMAQACRVSKLDMTVTVE